MVVRQSELDERFGFQPQAPEPSPSPVWGGFSDLFKGVAFGATEAVRGGWNFLNALDDMTVDWLPEWEQPVTEAPDSITGGLAAGFTQFFLPYGVLSKAIRGGSLALQHSRTGKLLTWLDGKSAVTAAEVAKKAQDAGRGHKAVTNIAMSFAKGSAGRGAVKGGVVDFLAFDANDSTLAQFTQEDSALHGLLEGAFGADDEDPELWGRLKNVFEGAAIGVAFDSVVDGLRAQHMFRKMKRNGATDDQAVEAAMHAFDDSKAARQAQLELEDDVVIEGQRDELFDMVDSEGNVVQRSGAEKDAAAEEVADLIDKALDDEAVEAILEDPQRARDVDLIAGDVESEGFSNINPRKDPAGRAKFNLERLDENLSYYFGDDGFAIRLRRQIERRAKEKSKLDPKEFIKHADVYARAVDDVADLGKKSLQEQNQILMSMGEDGEKLRELGYKAFMWRVYADRLAQEIQPMLKAYRGKNLDSSQLKMLYTAMDTMSGAVTESAKIFSGAGRILNIARIGISESDVVDNIAKGERFIKPLAAIDEMIKNPEAIDPAKINEMLDELDALTKSENGLDNLKALDAYLGSGRIRRGFKQLQETHINGLLSGISTHMVNISSAALMTIWRPIEGMMGATMDAAFSAASGNLRQGVQARQLFTQEMHSAVNLYTDFMAAWRGMKQSGGNPYETLSMLDKRPISPLEVSWGDNQLTKAIRLPTTALERMDNFFKMWSGRNRARGVIHQKLIKQGLHPSQVGKQTEDMLNKLQNHKGDFRRELLAAKELAENPTDVAAFTGEDVKDPNALANMTEKDLDLLINAKEQGIIRGQEVTFTHKMREGTFGSVGSGIQLALERVPFLKLLIPFVRTPANLADYGWDYTFGAIMGGGVQSAKFVGRKMGFALENTENSLLRVQRELASSDPMVRARARTRMSVGLGVASAIVLGASEQPDEDGLPLITGSGPANPDAQKALKEAGWQPFSIKIGGSYYSYSRLDPLSTVIGSIVDAAEYIRENNDDPEDVAAFTQAAFMGAMASIGNNITSKTYMKGVSDLLAVVNDPDNRVERFAGGFAGSFIPTIVANTERALDPEVQEIRDITDRLQSRIPGLSSRLPVRRNLLGEPVKYDHTTMSMFLPTRVSNVKDDVVRKELARFAYGFTMPTTTRAGVDLLDEAHDKGGVAAYDRFTELVGEVKIGGKDLRQTLRQKFKSPQYQALSTEDGEDGDKSPRILVIQAELRKYRQKAWDQLRRERPSIEKALRERRQRVQDRRDGKLTL